MFIAMENMAHLYMMYLFKMVIFRAMFVDQSVKD